VNQILGPYVGGITTLPPEGQSTGIYKQAATTPLLLTREGFVGDRQADRRVHGGPEKAVHHYAAENYARLAEAFPEAAADLAPGSLGENIATHGWLEDEVCIGDMFRLGQALLQVSQPRSPCWKINHKFAQPGMSRFIADHGITGWYYRVLEEGMVSPGDAFDLLERPAPGITLTRLWRSNIAHRPATEELATLLAAPGLAPAWAAKLAERRDWLARHQSN
jgi:MOSC domain-containing protein YiiM